MEKSSVPKTVKELEGLTLEECVALLPEGSGYEVGKSIFRPKMVVVRHGEDLVNPVALRRIVAEHLNIAASVSKSSEE